MFDFWSAEDYLKCFYFIHKIDVILSVGHSNQKVISNCEDKIQTPKEINDGIRTPHNSCKDPPQTYADVVRGHNSNNDDNDDNDKKPNKKVRFETNIQAH